MDNEQLSEKRKEADLITLALYNEYNFLIYIISTFFSYITIKRDGYISVTSESVESKLIGKPKLTDTMVKYAIRNILGVDIIYSTIQIKRIVEFEFFDKLKVFLMSKDQIEIDFANKLSKDIQTVLKDVYTKDDIELITNGAFNEIIQYMNFVFTQFIINDSEELSLDVIKSNIDNWTHRKGDNTFVPIDYKFNNDVYNTMLQSYIWILCGLTDWLEKDTIDETDVITANKILFYRFEKYFNDKINIRVSKNTPQYIVITDNVSGALYNHDFFVSKTALETLVKNMSNLINQYHTELLAYDRSVEQREISEKLLDDLESKGKLKFSREDTEYLIKNSRIFTSSDIYNHLMLFSKQI
jgi:hypothetical protein